VAVLEMPTPDPRTLDDSARPFAEAVGARYAIKRTIGSGGMGVVYLARDRRLDRHVAIKTLLPQLASDRTLRERFVREARAAGAMSHPNIVPIHEADEIDGHVYFVMGHVDGESLAPLIRAQGRLQPRMVAGLLRDVAAALAHAHGRGIIHRDIKAENILVDGATGRALVTDFGIARLAAAAPLTATGQLLGTVHYVSPEQVSGEAVDARSDLYSLGVVAFLALAGRFPFEAELASAVLVAHVTKAPPSIASTAADVPAALAAIVDRCLAKDPAARFASANAMLAALDDAVREMDRAAAPRAPREPRAPHAQRLSDTEAQAVWRRAAELQALTGVQPRPAAVPRARDAARDLARGGGLGVADVRAAAEEAGIDARYLDHALAEHGLSATGRLLRPVVARPRRWKLGALLAGAPLEIRLESTVAGELPAHEFDRVLNVLRDGTASLGVVTERKGELRWEGAWPGHRLEVSIVPDAGGTRIALAQHIGGAALGRTGAAAALVAGIAAPAVWLLLNVVLRVPAPEWGIRLTTDGITALAASGGVLTALAASPVARALVRRLRTYNEARLQTLGELLAVRVREGARALHGPLREERERGD
jgi:tRNA A-37 threonylcarbamoyl transferase component Bud32